MASTSKEITKDHELLIRIDERLLALVNRMTSIEQMMKDHQQQSDSNKIKIETLYKDIYGTKTSEGIITKVEKHDKLLTKAMVCFTIIGVVIDFFFNGILDFLKKLFNCCNNSIKEFFSSFFYLI